MPSPDEAEGQRGSGWLFCRGQREASSWGHGAERDEGIWTTRGKGPEGRGGASKGRGSVRGAIGCCNSWN